MQITQYETESTLNLGAKIWVVLSGETKNSYYLTAFQNEIRKWIYGSIVRHV